MWSIKNKVTVRNLLKAALSCFAAWLNFCLDAEGPASTVFARLMNALIFMQDRSKVGGVFIMLGIFSGKFFGMIRKGSNAKKWLGNLPFAVNIRVHYLRTDSVLLHFTHLRFWMLHSLFRIARPVVRVAGHFCFVLPQLVVLPAV